MKFFCIIKKEKGIRRKRMKSSLSKQRTELQENFENLSEAKQTLLKNNIASIKKVPEFHNDFPKVIDQAIQEVKSIQNISKLSISAFFDDYPYKYNDLGSIDRLEKYHSANNRPSPLRIKKLLRYFSDKTGHSVYISDNEQKLIDSWYEKDLNNFKNRMITYKESIKNQKHLKGMKHHLVGNYDGKNYYTIEEVRIPTPDNLFEPTRFSPKEVSPITEAEKKAMIKDFQNDSLALTNPTDSYYYDKTVFNNPNSLFKYLDRIILDAIESMLLLHQQMYWLNWDNHSIYDYLNASKNVTNIVRIKAAFISNINIAENNLSDDQIYFDLSTELLRSPYALGHGVFNYSTLLEDPIVTHGKKKYTPNELQQLFDKYYPNVNGLIMKWKNHYSKEVYDAITHELRLEFALAFTNLKVYNKQVKEKEIVFLTVANSVSKLLQAKDCKFELPLDPVDLRKQTYYQC